MDDKKGECLDVKAIELIKKYLEGDSLSLVKFWSVDFDYDGRVHRADKIMKRGETSCETDEFSAGDKISVCGYDVMGNRFFAVIRAD